MDTNSKKLLSGIIFIAAWSAVYAWQGRPAALFNLYAFGAYLFTLLLLCFSSCEPTSWGRAFGSALRPALAAGIIGLFLAFFRMEPDASSEYPALFMWLVMATFIVLTPLTAVFAALLRMLLAPAAGPAPADEGERSPVLVEGSTAFTGMHKGVKYWVYFDNNQARMEIEMGEEIKAPFIADRRTGPAKMPGDTRDADVLELFKLRAVYVEVAAVGNLIAVQFPQMVLNANAGGTAAPSPEEEVANKVAELLVAIREKSRYEGRS